MKELIPTINEIVKYGLKLLEKQLVKFYSLYFEIEYNFDETEYPAFDKSKLPDIRKNISSNFEEFGLYKTVSNINDIDNLNDNGIGDAIDDLSDIIIDLLEIKWRIENNSWNDGLWYYQFVFFNHTQQHLLSLLNYLKQKNG
jgi:hypothetical protein